MAEIATHNLEALRVIRVGKVVAEDKVRITMRHWAMQAKIDHLKGNVPRTQLHYNKHKSSASSRLLIARQRQGPHQRTILGAQYCALMWSTLPVWNLGACDL